MLNNYLRQVEGIEINKVSDGCVVNYPANNEVHYLNHTGTMLLELSDGETSISEMKELIKDVFELEELPGLEIDDYLQELVDKSLVIKVP